MTIQRICRTSDRTATRRSVSVAVALWAGIVLLAMAGTRPSRAARRRSRSATSPRAIRQMPAPSICHRRPSTRTSGTATRSAPARRCWMARSHRIAARPRARTACGTARATTAPGDTKPRVRELGARNPPGHVHRQGAHPGPRPRLLRIGQDLPVPATRHDDGASHRSPRWPLLASGLGGDPGSGVARPGF